MINTIIQWLNANQGLLAVLGIVIAAVISIWIFQKQSTGNGNQGIHHNIASPFIKAGGDISAGGNISIGNDTIIQSPSQNIPEIHLHLHGDETRSLEGHIENKSGRTLVAEYIEIDGTKTIINNQFTKLVPLKNLNFDHTIFRKEKTDIQVTVRYRTLTGDAFEYSDKGRQQYRRGDGKYNVGLVGSPVIRKVNSLSSEMRELLERARGENGQIYHITVDQHPSGWIRVGKTDYYFEDDYEKTQLYVAALHDLIDQG
ncbi:MAG: hypothetical protein KKG04_10630, partial [Candidatus Thermoplasmatota archaeon]|nr:hypothetical protein [Candidatus Thermoplasmatota archaeon]